ncbi:MAG: CapA family protein [Gammaproteobacteria bacterium]|nr:CapA family protein [Gammaproteobacteria bacterium]
MATHSLHSFFIMTMLLASIICSTGCSQAIEQTITLKLKQAEASSPVAGILPTTLNDARIKIAAVGDIMLGGTAEPVLQELGYSYPFDQVRHLLQSADISIGNLEGPLTHHDQPYANKSYLFRTPPELVAPALKQAGFTIMNLGNNHIMDYGAQGLKDTLSALQQQGIMTVGAGSDLYHARQATILSIKSQKIGFLSYSLTFPKTFWATETSPGTVFGHEKKIQADVTALRHDVDIVVVSFHWGQEKSNELREYQPILAHAAIDAGASLIIGHHPHVLQAVEQYKQGAILYSLGNFTFGSYSRSADISIIATAIFNNGQLESIEMTPISVLNIEVNFQPQRLTGQPAEQAIDHIKQLSLRRNTHIEQASGIAKLQSARISMQTNPDLH